MRAGYDALDDVTRERLTGLVAVRSASFSQAMAMGAGLPAEEERNLPPVRQPLVRVHEPTGLVGSNRIARRIVTQCCPRYAASF
jgi:hypothetical protein